LPTFLLEHKESVIALWGGFCLGLVAYYTFTWNRDSKIRISKKNFDEFLDDLKNRMNLIDSFVIDSGDWNLFTQWEQWQNSQIRDRKTSSICMKIKIK
jgi:hypothetical protein